MESTNEDLSAQQSLDLITAMIRQAKGNVSSNSFHLLLWGWTMVIANLGVFAMLKFTDIAYPQVFFSISIISAIISLVYGSRQGKNASSTTILDSANMWIWIGFMITCFTIVAFGYKTNWQVNPILITMASVPTFVTGVMVRFKPLMIGGIVLWAFGVILFLLPYDLQFIGASIAITIGYLVPGYMLKKSNV